MQALRITATLRRSERLRAGTAAALAGTLVLTASLANFLTFHDYPLWRPEVGLVVLGLAALSGLLAILYARSGILGRTLLGVLLVCIGIDLNFDSLIALMVAAVVAAALGRFLLPLVTITSTVVLVSQVVAGATGHATAADVPAPAVRGGNPPPALLHIILDEHIGPAGLPETLPQTRQLRRDLTTFYADRGFRLLGGAYSQYLHTTNAIPQILNFGVEQPWDYAQHDGRRLTRNAWFDRLRALGYRLRVYQSSFVDFCTAQQVQSCVQYREEDLAPIAGGPLSTGSKAALIAFTFADLSELITNGTELIDRLLVVASPARWQPPLFDLHQRGRHSAVAALTAFDRLIADLHAAQPGEAFIAHMLLPHEPAILKPDCTLKPRRQWQIRGPRTSPEAIQLAYADQVRCATAKVDAALAALAASPGGRNAIVIVHGDHGSRMMRRWPLVENEGSYDDEDLIAGYTTLFAVRAPGLAPGYDGTVLPVARVLEALAASSLRSADVMLPPHFVPTIMLEDRNWRPVRTHPLPAIWAERARPPAAVQTMNLTRGQTLSKQHPLRHGP